jgi:glycosyltransferase involved in cell wall biosynthesis
MVEAMACGLPVVAYRIPGVVDVVEEGETGTMVTEHDTTAHAAACAALLHSPTERTRLAENGRRTVTESLTIQRMTERVITLYQESPNA